MGKMKTVLITMSKYHVRDHRSVKKIGKWASNYERDTHLRPIYSTHRVHRQAKLLTSQLAAHLNLTRLANTGHDTEIDKDCVQDVN